MSNSGCTVQAAPTACHPPWSTARDPRLADAAKQMHRWRRTLMTAWAPSRVSSSSKMSVMSQEGRTTFRSTPGQQRRAMVRLHGVSDTAATTTAAASQHVVVTSERSTPLQKQASLQLIPGSSCVETSSTDSMTRWLKASHHACPSSASGSCSAGGVHACLDGCGRHGDSAFHSLEPVTARPPIPQSGVNHPSAT